MNTKRTRVVAGVLSAIVLSAPLATAYVPSLIFTNLTGQLRILQGVPCGEVVDVTTSIAGGRMEVTPLPQRSDAIGGGVSFHLTRLELFFTPFSVQHECNGVGGTVEFREIGVRLVDAVRFQGESLGGTLYRFTIPKEEVLILESVVTNIPVQQPQTRYERPSEDITGVIDLGRRTAELHVALASRVRFRAGCIGKRCLIDEVREGTQTTDVSGISYAPGRDVDGDGVPDLADNCPLVRNPDQSPVATPVLTPPAAVAVTSCLAHNIGEAEASGRCNARSVTITNNAPAKFSIGPNVVTWTANDGIDPIVTAQQRVTVSGVDTIPPTVSCTRVAHPRQHRVAAADDCGGRLTLKLGTFTLANDEVIQIEETGKPGIRLLGTVGNDGIRHFQVGKGQALVMATDDAGNVARAACGVPLDITPRR